MLLFEWLKNYAMNVCYRYANSNADLEDLVYDGFMRVYLSIGKYNCTQFGYNEANFKGWFKRVLINNCINYQKKYKINFETESIKSEIVDTYFSNTETAIERLSYNEILDQVMLLPKSYKTVFCLFVIDGYTHDEIAAQLNISSGTSKSNLFKAKQHLIKRLQK